MCMQNCLKKRKKGGQKLKRENSVITMSHAMVGDGAGGARELPDLSLRIGGSEGGVGSSGNLLKASVSNGECGGKR